jgi:excisionase family DNA binding protein
VLKPIGVDKLLYTPVEAAHALGISRSAIYVLMANGDIPSVRIGASRRVPVEALRRYVAGLGDPADVRRPPRSAGRKPKQQSLWR